MPGRLLSERGIMVGESQGGGESPLGQFAKRSVTAAVVIPTALLVVRKGAPTLTCLAQVGGCAAAVEAGRLLRQAGIPISIPQLTALTLGLISSEWPTAANALLVGVSSSLSMTPGNKKGPVAVVAAATAIGLPLRLGLSVRENQFGSEWLLWGMATTWLADAAAYLIGPQMRGPRLPASINAKKSWAGYLPGVAISLVSGWVFAKRLGLSRAEGLVVGTALGASVALGDMAESALKRKAVQSDSGVLLPGFGGVLDRLDSLLASTTTLALCQSLARKRHRAAV
jgi:phosphatidate cytidylyltransferase